MIVPAFGFGMSPRRPRILPSSTDQAHRVRRRERDVELEPAGLDLLDEVFATDFVGTGPQRLLRLLALGEDGDPDALAGAVRQHDRAADHLVGVTRVDTEAQVRLDGRVEVDGRRLLRELGGLFRAVQPLAIDELGRVLVFLAVWAMLIPPVGRRSDLPL